MGELGAYGVPSNMVSIASDNATRAFSSIDASCGAASIIDSSAWELSDPLDPGYARTKAAIL